MKKNFWKYFLVNLLLSIIIPLITGFLLLYIHELSFKNILIIVALIPWIIYRIILNFYMLFNPLAFFVLPYLIYYSLFTFMHIYFFKLNKITIGFTFTFIITIVNIYFWFQTFVLMTG